MTVREYLLATAQSQDGEPLDVLQWESILQEGEGYPEEVVDWALLRSVPGYTNFNKHSRTKIEIARQNAHAQIRDVAPVRLPGFPAGGLMTSPDLYAVSAPAPAPTTAEVIASGSYDYRGGVGMTPDGAGPVLDDDDDDDDVVEMVTPSSAPVSSYAAAPSSSAATSAAPATSSGLVPVSYVSSSSAAPSTTSSSSSAVPLAAIAAVLLFLLDN